jgi:hypothetical protein
MSVRIGIHLPCRSCRHDLKGVAAWERCPECGTPIMTTLVECTDAGVRGLLRLRHPWSVAIGLVLCCAALTLWWTCLSGPAGAARALTFVAEGAPQTPRMATLVASIAGAAGLFAACIGAWLMSARRDDVLALEYGPVVPRALWCLPAWLAIDGLRIAGEWSIFTPPLVGRGWSIACLAAEAGLACMVALGLRRAFSVLGRRSRTYREAHLARQDLDLLGLAGLVLLALATAEAVFIHRQHFDWVEMVRVMMLVVGGLLTLGMLYLAANSIWVARSLMALQLPLHEVLTEDPRPD